MHLHVYACGAFLACVQTPFAYNQSRRSEIRFRRLVRLGVIVVVGYTFVVNCTACLGSY